MCDHHGEESLSGSLAEETLLPPGPLLIRANEISFLFLVGGFCWKLDYICAILYLYRTMQRKGL